MKLTYNNLIDIFISEFPDICENRAKEIHDLSWEISQNLVYAFYEGIVRPHFLHLVEIECRQHTDEDGMREKLLNKLIVFFEEMANSDDMRVREVLQVAIFEFITDNIIILKYLPKILGDKSKIIFKESFNIET